MIRIFAVFLFTTFACWSSGCSQQDSAVIPAAERTAEYLPLLKNKRVALVANQTSRVGSTHLADSLMALGVKITKIFSPEHGFRGTSDAGQTVADGIDLKTGLPVISLYGSHKKPFPSDLADVYIVIFDIQDVGVRFYTYISTMHYVMEACAENGKKMVVLDRPNPNGNYIDGPVLEPGYRSFVGMDPVPVVYGMTIGEYALMINGEGWLNEGLKCDLTVVKCLHYRHDSRYVLPTPPSPNLPDQQSVRLYPSLAFFEGTNISVGRGTPWPFQVFGSPSQEEGSFYFTPRSTPGAALHPKHEGDKCRGVDLRKYVPPTGNFEQLQLNWLIEAYKNTSDKDGFFNAYFSKLAGTGSLQSQVENGTSEETIRESWQPGLAKFKSIRAKYLLYD